MSNGWIKIHRSIWDNPWMYKPYVYVIWSYILCHVNYQPTEVIFEGKRITLNPGQGLFKLREIAALFKVSPTSLHRIINLLKNETQIETQTSPRNTIITVVNWQKYQTSETQNGTQVEHKWNTSGTQTEHLPIIKEIEEVKKERNNNNTNVLFVIPAEDEPQKNGEYQPIIDAWNSLPLNNINSIRGKRLDSLRARIKEYSFDDVLHAISMIQNSPFLLGQNKHGWQITFDWFVKPNNFPKVLEGNYEKTAAPVGKNDVQAGYTRMMEILGGNNGNTD